MTKFHGIKDQRTGAGQASGVLMAWIVACVTLGCDDPIDDETPIDDDASEEAVSERGTTDPTNGASVYVGAKQWKQYSFTKAAGGRYTVCVESTDGDVDLYGHYAGPPSTSNYQYRSTETPSGAEGRHDCMVFNSTQGGTYYIGVYGYDSDGSTFRYDRSSSSNNVVPGYLAGKLKRPNNCTTPADTRFSPFNSPWGNPSHDPFYDGYTRYIHNGVDFACSAGTTVRAVCSGTITQVGDLGYTGSDWWGKYVKQECSFNGTKVTIAYDHLKSTGLPGVGNYVTAGTAIGSIVDLTLSGEPDHLHLGICTSSAANCSSLQGGAHKMTAGMPANYISADAPGLWAP